MIKMLKYKIHYNGDYEDELIITGETIEEVKEIAFAECAKRNWNVGSCWSEKID